MSNTKSSSKKSKKAPKKSASERKRNSANKSAGQSKSAPKSPDTCAGASNKSINRKTSSKEPKPKSSNRAADKLNSNFLDSSGSNDLTIQLEKGRKRLNQLDIEFREKLDEETKKYDRLEAEQAENIREKNRVDLEKTIKQLQAQFQAKTESTRKEFSRQQSEKVARLKKEESKASLVSDEKRTELEKEIFAKQEEAKAEISKYRKKRESELELQIKRLREQCEADVKEYTIRRLETNEQLLEQIRQKLDLEIKNDKQKGKLVATLKVDKVKERFQNAAAIETEKLNAALVQAIDEQKASSEAHLEQAIAENKKLYQAQLVKSRTLVDECFREERAQLLASIEEWENTIKGNLKQEKRLLERRKSMKQELLAMLAYEDTHKLADEDLIFSRFGFKIERSQILVQSSASTVYAASQNNSPCACKVTMLSKWSTRHRLDFAKNGHATKLARYLSANRGKAANAFVHILDVLATEAKVYTLMQPLDCPKTLSTYLDSFGCKLTKSASSKSTRGGADSFSSSLRKIEFLNVLSQVCKGCRWLNHLFIAHGNLTADNVTLLLTGSIDMSNVKVVLTGLSRPILYYSVESDSIIATKGFDLSVDSPESIDHLPPECFESEFQATHLDGYSIGVLAYQMLRRHSPFAKYASSPKKMLAVKQAESVKLSLDKAESEHSQLVALVASFTNPKPNRRMQIDEVLNHSYFN